jgi:hypothetical protein
MTIYLTTDAFFFLLGRAFFPFFIASKTLLVRSVLHWCFRAPCYVLAEVQLAICSGVLIVSDHPFLIHHVYTIPPHAPVHVLLFIIWDSGFLFPPIHFPP